MQEKIVLIGGPGTGKSSVLNQLELRGYRCMPEISRDVTIKAQKEGIAQLFLEQPLLFSEKLLEGREQQFLDAENSKDAIVFFDRGIPSVVAYMRYFNTEFPPIFLEKNKHYKYTKVFEFLPWKDIYISDNERYETFEQCLEISTYLRQAYLELGYDIITVPFGTIDERSNFILNSL